jgi:hypothetical protein
MQAVTVALKINFIKENKENKKNKKKKKKGRTPSKKL